MLTFLKVIICNSICNSKDNRQRLRVEEVARPHTSPYTNPFKIQPPVLHIISTTRSSNSSTRAPKVVGERRRRRRRRRPRTLRQRRVENRRAVLVAVAVATRLCQNRATTSVSAPSAAIASWARVAVARPWAECTTWRASRALTAAAFFRASRSMLSTESLIAKQTISRRWRSAASAWGPFSTAY